jgi:MFS family permease
MNQLISFSVSCLVLATSGCLGAFSVISDGLREQFNWSFSQVNLVNAIGNASLYLAYLGSGPIYDRYGERVTMTVGMVTFTFGYLMIWLTFKGLVPHSVFLISIYYVIAGFGSCSGYMVGIGVNVANFDQNIIGAITGILLLFYGFSGTIYSQIYSIWYSTSYNGTPDIEGFLLFTTISIFLVNTLGIVLIKRFSPPKKVNTNIVIRIRGNDFIEMDPLKVPVPEAIALLNGSRVASIDTSMTPRAILKSKIFWLYAFTCIFSQGLTYMANVNAIIRSSNENAPKEWYSLQTTLQVTICSVSQSIGRLLFGVLSDIVSSYHYDRSILLVFSQIILFLPPLILSFVSLNSENFFVISICSVLVGLGFGATWVVEKFANFHFFHFIQYFVFPPPAFKRS